MRGEFLGLGRVLVGACVGSAALLGCGPVNEGLGAGLGQLSQQLSGTSFFITEIAQDTLHAGSTSDKVEVYCADSAGCPAFRVCDPTSTGSVSCSALQSALGTGERAVVSRGSSITANAYEEIWLEDCSGACTEVSGTRVLGPITCPSGESEARWDCASSSFGSCAAAALGTGVACEPSCGDQLCTGAETCSSCSTDCGECNVEPFVYTLQFAENQHGSASSTCTSDLCTTLKGLIDAATTRIDFAIYGVRAQQAIIDALVAAQTRGVTVRGIVDSENAACGSGGLYTYPDTLTLLNQLSIGTVVCDNGTGFGYIMHNKFFVLDGQKLWTGSTNISDTETGGELNADVVAVFTSDQLASIYTAEFDEMYAGAFHHNKADNTTHLLGTTQWADGSTVLESYFAPTDDATTHAMLRMIDAATTSLDVAIFYLTHDAIGDALVAAHNRGVLVRVVLDATGAGSAGSEKGELCAAGIQLKVENWPGKQHSKWGVADGQVVVFGSQNWTAAGNDDNDENTLYVDNGSFAAAFVDEFARQWADLATVANCASTSAEGADSPGTCSDGSDNDHDGDVDCDDFGCAGACAIVVNECLPAPSSGPEWIELFNPKSVSVDVSGAYVDDAAGGSSPQQIPSGSVVPANGVLLVNLSGSILNNSGSDACRLLSASQVEMASISYSSAAAGASRARLPNGSGAPAWDTTPTPGSANQ